MFQVFQKFGPRSEKILMEAQSIALKLKRPLKSDCLVLAFLSDFPTLSGDLLKLSGLSKENVERNLEPSPGIIQKAEGGLVDELKRLIKESAYLAFKQKSIYIEPEFVLLSILRNPNYSGYQLLKRSELNIEKIDKQLQEWLNHLTEITEKDDIWNDVFEESSVYEDDFEEELEPMNRLNRKKNLTIDFFGRDITEEVRKGLLDKISCRDNEVETLVRILLRRNKNNPLIIGEPGVGKTALVEALAQSIVAKNVPKALTNKRIVALDLTKLVAGTIYRGQFEERMTRIIEEAKIDGNIILFIDEMHSILGAGGAEGSQDVAQILKPSLATGDFSIIGSTTFDEFRKYIEKDKALSRRFSVVQLTEPSFDDTIIILQNLKTKFENHHGVAISDKLITHIVQLAERYIPERFFPDKAIDLLDESAASVIPKFNQDPRIDEVKKQLAITIKDKLIAINLSDYELGRSLRKREDILHAELMRLEKDKNKNQLKISVELNDVAKVVSEKVGLPIKIDQNQLKINLPEKIDEILKSETFGQDEALAEISFKLKEAVYNKKRSGPLASMVFIGPTGVGKTATAKLLAREIFGSSKNLIKLDMSEFSERHSSSFLIGAPAGFVGFEEGGKLTNAVRRSPFSIVLFDEIEKAHPDVFNLLLQILEDGYLTDNIGRKVDFSHTVVILTSNLGNKNYPGLTPEIGFHSQLKSTLTNRKHLRNFYRKELNEFLSPELLGRLSDIIVFSPLSLKANLSILRQEIKNLKDNFRAQGLQLIIPKGAEKFLLEKIDAREGARSVKKVVNNFILKPVISFLETKSSKKIRLSLKNNQLTPDPS